MKQTKRRKSKTRRRFRMKGGGVTFVEEDASQPSWVRVIINDEPNSRMSLSTNRGNYKKKGWETMDNTKSLRFDIRHRIEVHARWGELTHTSYRTTYGDVVRFLNAVKNPDIYQIFTKLRPFEIFTTEIPQFNPAGDRVEDKQVFNPYFADAVSYKNGTYSFTPLRIENAQSASSSSLITAPEGGVLSERRRRRDINNNYGLSNEGFIELQKKLNQLFFHHSSSPSSSSSSSSSSYQPTTKKRRR